MSSLLTKYILDENRNPVPCDNILVWAEWFENADEQRRVGLDEIWVRRGLLPKRVAVSTVFLGLDHNFSEVGPPVLFETLIAVHGGGSDVVARYCTWREAETAHHRMVRALKGELSERIELPRAYSSKWERFKRWWRNIWRRLWPKE